jgi:hypothetical protein
VQSKPTWLVVMVLVMASVVQVVLAGGATAQTTARHRSPGWAAALGSGVTVIKLGTKLTPGTTSPGAVVEAETAAENTPPSRRISRPCQHRTACPSATWP